MKLMLRKAVEWRFLEVSVAHGIRYFKEKSLVPQRLESEEVARFLEEVPPHFHALVACAVVYAAYAGLCRSELFHLRWEQVYSTRSSSNSTTRIAYGTEPGAPLPAGTPLGPRAYRRPGRSTTPLRLTRPPKRPL